MISILSAEPMAVRYGFDVYVQNMGDKWNVSLNTYECFIDLASGDRERLPYYCVDNYFKVKNVGANDKNYITLANRGVKSLGNALDGFVTNIIEVFHDSDSAGYRSVRYYTNAQYINLATLSIGSIVNVNLIHRDYFPSMGVVHEAMHSNTLEYDFY